MPLQVLKGNCDMKFPPFKTLGIAAVVLVAIPISFSITSVRVRANDDDDRDNTERKIEIGFKIAPVRLNLDDKDHDLVGYGSYLVNAVMDCNGCHSAGPPTEYLPDGNPYFGKNKEIVNPATYLGGGRDFGPLIPGSATIISRNLTPDETGLPGGNTLERFLEIMKTGKDFDHLHPTCSDAPNANCVPKPFDGSLLQIMPWPVYKHATEGELRAIYEYLRAIPCIAGPDAPSPLHNDCP